MIKRSSPPSSEYSSSSTRVNDSGPQERRAYEQLNKWVVCHSIVNVADGITSVKFIYLAWPVVYITQSGQPRTQSRIPKRSTGIRHPSTYLPLHPLLHPSSAILGHHMRRYIRADPPTCRGSSSQFRETLERNCSGSCYGCCGR